MSVYVKKMKVNLMTKEERSFKLSLSSTQNQNSMYSAVITVKTGVVEAWSKSRHGL